MSALKMIEPEEVLSALRLWHGGDTEKWPLAHLRLSSEAVVDEAMFGSLAQAGPAARNRAVLDRGLKLLAGTSPEADDLLRWRFEHRQEAREIANRLNLAEATIFFRQRQAIKQLTELLNRLESDLHSGWKDKMLSRLDLPSYEDLVGIEEARAALKTILLDNSANFIAAIDGLGGIGKTSLADRVVRDIIAQGSGFDEIGWVTAKQTHLSSLGRLQVESGRPALTFPMLLDKLAEQFTLIDISLTSQLERHRFVQRQLRERTCLIVIDNLETVADYDTLLPELRQWLNPTKFLLTSRRRMLDRSDIFSISLRELPPAAAFELIRMEARRVGYHELQGASTSELQRIYDAVGGNPLALKLVTGQLRFYSLHEVLDRFNSSKKDNPTGLLDYVYREAWESLSDYGREILLVLMEAGETGFTLKHTASLVDMTETNLHRNLEELILLSLVDMGGSLLEKRYRLHRLTEVFLRQLLS